jgi:hypothetical protein
MSLSGTLVDCREPATGACSVAPIRSNCGCTPSGLGGRARGSLNCSQRGSAGITRYPPMALTWPLRGKTCLNYSASNCAIQRLVRLISPRVRPHFHSVTIARAYCPSQSLPLVVDRVSRELGGRQRRIAQPHHIRALSDIWCERNTRMFDQEERNFSQIVAKIKKFQIG